jgi:hypothetical protein
MRYSSVFPLLFPLFCLICFPRFTAPASAPASAEEFALVYNNRIMEEIALEEPQFAKVDIGEIQPEDGGEPVFGILIPRDGVVRQDGVPYALVKTEEGLVGKKLDLGVMGLNRAEVVEGALPDDEVLVSELDRVWSEYWKLRQLWDDPVRNPEVAREIQMLYRRFFNYTAITLIIAIPLILWLRKRARGNINRG